MPVWVFSNTHTESEGKKLTYQFWKAVQEKKMKKVNALLSPDFQAISPSGALSRKQELRAFGELSISHFHIHNVQSTSTHHRIVITYDLELINNHATPSSSWFHQLFVWVKQDSRWQLVADTFIPFTTPR